MPALTIDGNEGIRRHNLGGVYRHGDGEPLHTWRSKLVENLTARASFHLQSSHHSLANVVRYITGSQAMSNLRSGADNCDSAQQKRLLASLHTIVPSRTGSASVMVWSGRRGGVALGPPCWCFRHLPNRASSAVNLAPKMGNKTRKEMFSFNGAMTSSIACLYLS